MDNRRSSLSYILPAILCFALLFPTGAYGRGWPHWQEQFAWACGCLFALWALVNFWLYVLDGITWQKFLDDAVSPATHAERMAERLKALDPRALKYLMQTNGGAWSIRPAVEGSESGPDYLLYGTRCHMAFVKHILDNSTDDFLWPQRNLMDQTYEWDPIYREITDREQYRELETWLIQMNWCAWHGGNRSARFINGWTPRRIAERLDLDAFEFSEKPIPVEMKVPELKP